MIFCLSPSVLLLLFSIFQFLLVSNFLGFVEFQLALFLMCSYFWANLSLVFFRRVVLVKKNVLVEPDNRFILYFLQSIYMSTEGVINCYYVDRISSFLP